MGARSENECGLDLYLGNTIRFVFRKYYQLFYVVLTLCQNNKERINFLFTYSF